MWFCGTHPGPISQELLKISIRKMSFKTNHAKLFPYPSEANEFIFQIKPPIMRDAHAVMHAGIAN